jgi:hypothetical protein
MNRGVCTARWCSDAGVERLW